MMKLWLYEKHICELRSEELYEGRSSQFFPNFCTCEKKALTSAIAVQCSTNLKANKPIGSRSLNNKYWFVINPWKDDDEVMTIWESYMWTAEWRIIWRKIIAVMYATFAVGKRNPEKKFRLVRDLNPSLTSAIALICKLSLVLICNIMLCFLCVLICNNKRCRQLQQ